MLSHDTRRQEKTQYCSGDSTSDLWNIKMKDKGTSERSNIGHSSLDDKHLDKYLDIGIPLTRCPLAVTCIPMQKSAYILEDFAVSPIGKGQ